jgi:N-acetyl-anhydromuramyl-L-alanine amidase AmpD
MAGALAVGFPREIADELLGKLQISARDNVVGAIAEVRADLSKSSFFRVPSSPRTISDIVIHVTESSDKEALRFLLDRNNPRGASYHYLILRDGKVMNLVDEANIALHDPGHNETTIGVGISAPGTEERLPQVEYQALLTLVAEIAKRHSIPVAHVVGHREISPGRTDCPRGVDMKTIRSELQHLIQ